MDVGIIGAGFTGLAAAYELTCQGHQATVYEARPYAGGLAAGFRDARWEWPLERFYHHWFASDAAIVRLVEELGVRDRLFFPRPTTTVYYQGRLYPMDSPVHWLRFLPLAPLHRAVRVLQFAPLPLSDRLRAGLMGVLLILGRNWRRLERVSADEWMRRKVGERAYEVLWKPLLISKFGEENYRDVNMAWMWARLVKRTASLGYFTGGFQGLIDLLVERVRTQGGLVRLRTGVRSVCPTADGRLQLETDAGVFEHQRVIATCSPQGVRRLVADLPFEYASRLDGLRSMGALALVLALKQRLTAGHYWINLPKSEGIPFMGLVEHTNYIAPDHYGGDHLVYCGDYLPPEHPYFGFSKEQLLETYLPGLVRINPEFSLDWVRASWMFAEAYAQPVPTLNHSRNLPALRTPVAGLWVANMSQVYPWDRGSNYAVEMGRRVAREIVR
jgi:protoporphyrinogen oxidase